jgi:hypothetical protein
MDECIERLNKEFFTVTEAAKHLRVTVSAIQSAVLRKRIPPEAVKEIKGLQLLLRAAVESYKAETQPNGVPVTGRPKRKA